MNFTRRLACLAAGLGAMFASVPALAERPVEVFGNLPTLGDIEISPDGSKIAANMAIDGEMTFVILPLGGQGEAVPFRPAENVDIWDVTWVNDDWLVLRVGTMGFVNTQYSWLRGVEVYTTRFIAFRADGGEQHVLEPRRNDMIYDGGKIIWTARDGSPEILLGYRTSLLKHEEGFSPKVMRVDVAKNKFKLEKSPMGGIDSYVADGDGDLRAGFGYLNGGSDMRIVYGPGDGASLNEVAKASSDDADDLIMPQIFLPNSDKALAFAAPDGFTGIYELDLETMEVGDKVFGVKGYDVTSILPNRARDGIVGIGYTDTMRRTLWLDPAMQQVQALLDQTFVGKQANIISSSWSYDRHIVSVGLPSEPSSIYLFDVPNKKLSLLAKPAAAAASGNGTVTSFVYTARDGMKIPAILTLPPGKEAKDLPLVVFPHGGPMARDYERYDWWAQFMADRGYAVIQPNFRGSTGFGTQFEEAGLGEWGLKMQDDVDDVRAWAIETGLADADRVCIAGGSYGGYVAMRAAQRNPDLYKCAISFAGVSDLPRMMRSDSRTFINGRSMREYWLNRTDDLAKVSPINFPEEFGTPILIVHGKDDARVPIAQSREMAEKLQALNKDVTYVEQEKGDHHFSRRDDRIQFLELTGDFLDKHNPAD